MIEAKNLSKVYGKTKVLTDVSIKIQKGEIVGLVGVNGAGKSTLMKLLAGIINPNSGTISISNISLLEEPTKAKKHIGYLSEDNPLYEDMYVREYLSYVARLYNIDKLQLDDLLSSVGLVNEQKKKIKTLSKGNRQRVGIAQAILHRPDFLILDEPSSGLDPNQREQINKLFIDLSEESAILFSTHLFQEVEDICTRYILIHGGKIVADKPKSEIHTIRETFNTLTNENSSR